MVNKEKPRPLYRENARISCAILVYASDAFIYLWPGRKVLYQSVHTYRLRYVYIEKFLRIERLLYTEAHKSLGNLDLLLFGHWLSITSLSLGVVSYSWCKCNIAKVSLLSNWQAQIYHYPEASRLAFGERERESRTIPSSGV